MRTLNLGNYAALYESKKMGYVNEAETAVPAVNPAPAASPAASTLSELPTDSEEVKKIKKCILTNTPPEVKAAIDAKAAELANSLNMTESKFSVTIDTVEIKVVLKKLGTLADGTIQIKPDYDSTAKLIEGLDLDYITGQLKKGSDKTFLGIDFGTDEEKLASVAGSIYSYCYDKKANPKDVFAAIGTRYQERYGEAMLTMIDGEFTGSPDAFARGLFGQTLTQEDISTALGVDALQSIAVDVSIMIGTYALTAFTGGAAAPAAVASTAETASALKNVMTLGRAGKEVRTLQTAVGAGEEALTAANLTYKTAKTGEIIASAQKLKNIGTAISLSAEEVNALRGVKNFASIERFLTATKGGAMSLNGEKMAAEMAKDSSTFFQSLKELAKVAPQAVKNGLATLDPKTAALIVGGAALAIDAVPDTVAALKGGEPQAAGSAVLDEKTLTTFCDELHRLAKGYTGGDSELKIAFAMLSLTPETWKMVNDSWNKNYTEEGTLYAYCVSSELSGDLAVLVDGYLAGIGCNETDLTTKVQEIKTNLEKTAIPAAPQAAQATNESLKLKTFSNFLKR